MPVPAIYQAQADFNYARVTGVAAAAAVQLTPLTDSRSGQAVPRSGGFIYGFYIVGVGITAPAYLKFYDLAAASVVVGTTPVLLTIPVPATTFLSTSTVHVKLIGFDNTLSVAATNLAGDTDTTALTAGSLTVQLIYR